MRARLRRGDRVDFNNGWARGEHDPNGTPGTIRRVIIKREYVITWDDGNQDNESYREEELIQIQP